MPAGEVARTLRALVTSAITLALSASTLRKSARIPSSMICRLMFTMCACRMRRRLTMSVICMRERSSFRWTRDAKMLTWLFSMSAAIAAGRSVSGRGATSSRMNAW